MLVLLQWVKDYNGHQRLNFDNEDLQVIPPPPVPHCLHCLMSLLQMIFVEQV